MKGKELCRFKYENIDYILGVNEYQIGDEIVAEPWILVTTRSSKKFRKSSINTDGHFKLVGLDNPIGAFKKIFSILENGLKKYDYVYFSAYKDKKYKREKIYRACLEKMGFILQKEIKGLFLMSRKPLKNKTIIKYLNDET